MPQQVLRSLLKTSQRDAPLDDIVILGRTNLRRRGRRFGVQTGDCPAHAYVIGSTGTGKSTLLESMICQYMAAGRGSVLRIWRPCPDARKRGVGILSLDPFQALLGTVMGYDSCNLSSR